MLFKTKRKEKNKKRKTNLAWYQLTERQTVKCLTQFLALNKHSVNGFDGITHITAPILSDIIAVHITLRAGIMGMLVNDPHSSPN